MRIVPKSVLAILALGLLLTACKRNDAPIPAAATPASWAYSRTSIGRTVVGQPWITHLLAADLEGVGRSDLLGCDGRTGEVFLLRLGPDGNWDERVLASGLPAPVHLDVADVDGDGRRDILVACMGEIMPNNDPLGSVVLLINQGDGGFRAETVLKDVARVTDVRGADLNGDGRLDLVVAQFGYVEGEVRWMENLGDGGWRSHLTLSLAGAIHAPLLDANGDGHVDFAVLVSQDWEEVHLFLNDGRGGFSRRIVWGSTNTDFGMSGMTAADVDGDGRDDLVFTNGDAFDFAYPGPRPWHGVQWLRNEGAGTFSYHRLGDFAGAFGPSVADFDGDGDKDIAVVSAFNHWDRPDAVTLGIFEQTSPGRFALRAVARRPTHLLATAAADFDGDGIQELATGSMHAFPPFENLNRVLWWRRSP